MDDVKPLPVAVIGAGPVGLAAAAHLLSRGLEPLIFEAGDSVGASVRDWAHVRVFSPWAFNIDPAAADLLEADDWVAPPAEEYPTGGEIVERYLEPLAALPAIDGRLVLGARVTAVTRLGIDKLKDAGREQAPFELIVDHGGIEQRYVASAVIDASGTWTRPNPLGAGGVPAAGERAHQERIAYRIPDVLGADRDRYAGKRVLVIGTGHSAFNALVDLVALRQEAPSTEIVWAVRRDAPGDKLGGGSADQLPERGALGETVRRLVEETGAVQLVTGFQTRSIDERGGQIVLGDGARELVADEVIATTGFRPDLSLLGELRLDLDDRVEAPRTLAPLIDPNLHSCGTVPPHGVDELSHPDPDVYVVGMKSYGRAPTFLLRTGYEQVRSVVAALDGDWQAARTIDFVLPETGVCNVNRAPATESPAASACCGAGSPHEEATAAA